MSTQSKVPIPLSREIDPDALCRENPCDSLHILGSFWPNTRTSFESRIVKGFKECSPTVDYEPHISVLCRFYADRVCEVIAGEKPDWIVRVLGSSETATEPSRPQTLLTQLISHKIGAREATHIFFKSGARPPMRTVSHLSGPEALKTRIRYASQDLFIKPSELGGTALLLDDIMNTGASVRVYGAALKRWAGVGRVVCVNLAATRFGGGKDGHGMLKLDFSLFDAFPDLQAVWLDSDSLFHKQPDCIYNASGKSIEMRFMAERKAKPCPECYAQVNVERKWWQFRK